MTAASLCVNGPVCIPLPHLKPVGADVFGATLSPIGLEGCNHHPLPWRSCQPCQVRIDIHEVTPAASPLASPPTLGCASCSVHSWTEQRSWDQTFD